MAMDRHNETCRSGRTLLPWVRPVTNIGRIRPLYWTYRGRGVGVLRSRPRTRIRRVGRSTMSDVRVQIRMPEDLYLRVIKAADERAIGVDLFVRLALLDTLTEDDDGVSSE